MNERIKELALQAGQVTVFEINGVPILHYYVAGDGWVTVEPLVEKLAELIVKDCASICEINGQSYKHSFTPAKARLAESTSNHCGRMIKQHFGVEE